MDGSGSASPPKKYCASPWLEGVVRMSGGMTPCCRSGYDYGDWNETGLEAPWKGNNAQKLRKAIIEGKFANEDCRTCFQNNAMNSMGRVLGLSLQRHAMTLKAFNVPSLYPVARLKELFDKKDLDQFAKDVLFGARKQLVELEGGSLSAEYKLAIHKISVLADVIESFLRGDLEPEHVAPIRQVNAVAKCNARCIQCMFLFTGEIIRGVPMPDGTFKTHLDRDEQTLAFSNLDSALDFFLNGSEFFLIKHWKDVAAALAEKGVQIRISTNGMLMTRENIRFLVNGGFLAKLNCSIDGATRGTIEDIRRNVKFDALTRNLEDMFDIVASNHRHIGVSASFCLMARNYRELPLFVDFIADRLGNNIDRLTPTIMVQPIEMRGTQAYLDFAHREHASNVQSEDLKAAFEAMLDRAKARKIPVHVFYTNTLENFIADGCPVPMPEDVLIADGVGLLDAHV